MLNNFSSNFSSVSKSPSKSNYLFKKDLQLLDKEVELIKCNISQLDENLVFNLNCLSPSKTQINSENISKLSVVDKIVDEIIYEVNNLRNEIINGIHEESEKYESIMNILSESNYAINKEIDNYKEEVTHCKLLINFSI